MLNEAQSLSSQVRVQRGRRESAETVSRPRSERKGEGVIWRHHQPIPRS